MKAVTIRSRRFVPQGKVFVLPDTEHPEVSPWTTLDEADHLLVACHPSDEQAVRDAVAVAQERPRWWRDVQAIERALSSIDRAT